jgi:hypothetical protein
MRSSSTKQQVELLSQVRRMKHLILIHHKGFLWYQNRSQGQASWLFFNVEKRNNIKVFDLICIF